MLFVKPKKGKWVLTDTRQGVHGEGANHPTQWQALYALPKEVGRREELVFISCGVS